MLKPSSTRQRQYPQLPKSQGGDLSLNDSHAAGRSENSRLLLTAALIVAFVPLAAGALLLVLAMGPGRIFFRDAGQILDFEQLRRYLGVFAVDAAGLSSFIAFGGLLLAINRFEGARQSDIDAETAMRSFMVLRFRNTLQWLAILGTATGPLGGIIWVVLFYGHDGWVRGAIAVAVASAATWIVLVLSVPSSGYFGLQSVAHEWALIHTAFRRDMLVKSWGNRWRMNLHSTPAKRWWMWRITWRWLVIAVAPTAEVILLAEFTDNIKPDWSDPRALLSLITLYIFNAYLGGIVLLLAGLIVEMGITATNRGWRRTAIALKSLALLIGPGIAVALMGFDYLPFVVMNWTVATLQFLFVLGMLNNGGLGGWFWLPVRGLVLSARSLSHQWAHDRWKSLDESLNASLTRLPRAERRRKLKEISQWRDRIT